MTFDLITLIWFTPSVLLSVFAAYYSLEGIRKPSHRKLAIHHLQQAGFMLFAALICLLVNQYLLSPLLLELTSDNQIQNLSRFLLFPALVYILAKLHGGKKDQAIDLNSIRKRRNK